MHRTLARAQSFVWWVLVIIIMSVTAVAGFAQKSDYDSAATVHASSEKAAHFWRVVGRAESAASPTIANLFARDIRDLDRDELDRFRGSSNRYGGVVEAIGFDPFDETGLNCVECGPLDAETKANVLTVQAGGLEQVVGPAVAAPARSLTLTPFGWTVLSTLIVYWLLVGTVSLVLGHRLAQATNYRYVRNFGDLNWHLNGDENSDKLVSWCFAPVALWAWMFWQSKRADRFQEQVRETFPQPMALLDDVDRVLDQAPEHSDLRQRLGSLRDEVHAELESQTRSGADGTDVQLQVLLEQLEETSEFLKARLEARNELS